MRSVHARNPRVPARILFVLPFIFGYPPLGCQRKRCRYHLPMPPYHRCSYSIMSRVTLVCRWNRRGRPPREGRCGSHRPNDGDGEGQRCSTFQAYNRSSVFVRVLWVRARSLSVQVGRCLRPPPRLDSPFLCASRAHEVLAQKHDRPRGAHSTQPKTTPGTLFHREKPFDRNASPKKDVLETLDK